MSRRGIFAAVFAVVLFASLPAPVGASPDAPMCVADFLYPREAPISLVRWHAPMCGPYSNAYGVAEAQPLKARAVEAYREASEQIADANYENARLQLDLAYRGLPRIGDRIALKSARLELLRNRPMRAAEFFAEAMESPHESVRVQARCGHVLALLRADEPSADQALEEILSAYPEAPNRTELISEHIQSLLRRGRYEESIAAMRSVIVDDPGSRIARWAESELTRLRARGHSAPSLTDEERVQQAERLVLTGPLDEAKVKIASLLESPLTGEQHAEVHFLAGRLARDEGRWQTAETYLRTAQLFSVKDLTTAKQIESRATEMTQTARARDPDFARRELASLRAGRRNASIPSTRLVEMLHVSAAAGLREETDGLLASLGGRDRVPSVIAFDAAMGAVGTGSEDLIIPLLESLAKRPDSSFRAAAMYHLARAHERGGRSGTAALYFHQAKRIADLVGDAYYALWAANGLARIEEGREGSGLEGLSEPGEEVIPSVPRASDRALAKQLEPIAEAHAGSYPWIARAADLLLVGEPEAATAELFETYLSWREARGKPIARAGLACIAREDAAVRQAAASDVRAARLELTDGERATLAATAAALGDMGTAGGFAGPDFIESLPRAYEWLAVPAAKRYGLDPNLLLAVMRVESAYQKRIVSYAGAVGLMQIMPRTGRLIAHALGREDFTPADLLDPGVNLTFAAWYLTSLIHRFDGRLPLAIAAYNGGPHNVRRWIQESAAGAPVDVLLERIPFAQTHRYVRRVLAHYEAYRRQRDLPMPQLSLTTPAQRVDPLAF